MKRFLLTLLLFYRRWISPGIPSSCRFVPTCSTYAMEAIEKRGIMRGCILILWRLVRCHPLCRGGYDPVPPGKNRETERVFIPEGQ
ncbi:MAG: membrane protein insertion efficiency factor YidD [Deltaproteobacteria bacterium]|nr:membrane protein insertion efficiency factor YidD [Deltaproteobacteria bacterium]